MRGRNNEHNETTEFGTDAHGQNCSPPSSPSQRPQVPLALGWHSAGTAPLSGLIQSKMNSTLHSRCSSILVAAALLLATASVFPFGVANAGQVESVSLTLAATSVVRDQPDF